MHCSDCNGVAGMAWGGIFGMAFERHELGANQTERLHFLNRWMRQWYDRRPGHHRLPTLTSKSVRSDKWWELSGPAIKAAGVRATAPLFADFAAEFFTGATEKTTTQGC